MKVRCTSLSGDDGPHFEILQLAGFEVLPGNRSRNYFNTDELIAELQGCSAIVAGAEPYPHDVLTALPELRVIARTGVGFDAIDLAACDELGIVVTTTPGVNHIAVAEHTIALLMGVARGFPDRDQQVRVGRWQRFNTPRVTGSTLAVIGLGRIGQAVAERALGLGMKVIAYDPYPAGDFVERTEISIKPLEECWPVADFISLHLPATPETFHLINQKTLKKMKQGAVVLNTARGSLIDEQALCDALQSGHLAGAGLDVFETEPLPLESPLLQQNRVLLSGHVAGLDEESKRDTLIMSAETIVALKNGEWPAEIIQNQALNSDWRWECG